MKGIRVFGQARASKSCSRLAGPEGSFSGSSDQGRAADAAGDAGEVVAPDLGEEVEERGEPVGLAALGEVEAEAGGSSAHALGHRGVEGGLVAGAGSRSRTSLRRSCANQLDQTRVTPGSATMAARRGSKAAARGTQ